MDILTRGVTDISEWTAAAGPAIPHGKPNAVRLIRVWLALLLWLSVPPLVKELQAQSRDEVLEYRVKAAYLLNFTKFVEWPAAAFAAPDAPITICVMGQDPFGTVLDKVVEGESVDSHGIRVRRLLPDSRLQNCHILFVSRSERERSSHIVSELRGSSVLTVSELPGFASAGGTIEFIVDAGKVRFEINAATAETSGLKLSSRLLRVAKQVKGSRG